jgi:hypothetical protein
MTIKTKLTKLCIILILFPLIQLVFDPRGAAEERLALYYRPARKFQEELFHSARCTGMPPPLNMATLIRMPLNYGGGMCLKVMHFVSEGLTSLLVNELMEWAPETTLDVVHGACPSEFQPSIASVGSWTEYCDCQRRFAEEISFVSMYRRVVLLHMRGAAALLCAYLSARVVDVWAILERITSWLWFLAHAFSTGTVFRDTTHPPMPPYQNVRRTAEDYYKNFTSTYKEQEGNEHAELALERKRAINAMVVALSQNYQMKVHDVCGVPTRIDKVNHNRVVVHLVEDAVNATAITHVNGLDIRLTRPGEELRAYDGPVLLSLADWFYTVEELTLIFKNYGGVVLTIPFVGDNVLHVDGKKRFDYIASQNGVRMTVYGGDTYHHGYHKWEHQGFLASKHGVLAYHKIGFASEGNHMAAYVLTPFAGTVHSDSSLESVAIRAECRGVLNVTPTSSSYTDPAGHIHQLKQGVLQSLAQDVPEGVARVRSKAILLLSKEQEGHLYQAYVEAAFRMAAVTPNWDFLGWWWWLLAWVPGLYPTFRKIRRHFSHVVSVAPEADVTVNLESTLGKRVFTYPRARDDPATSDRPRLSAGSGRGTGEDKRKDQSEKSSTTSTNVSRTTVAGNRGADRRVHSNPPDGRKGVEGTNEYQFLKRLTRGLPGYAEELEKCKATDAVEIDKRVVTLEQAVEADSRNRWKFDSRKKWFNAWVENRDRPRQPAGQKSQPGAKPPDLGLSRGGAVPKMGQHLSREKARRVVERARKSATQKALPERLSKDRAGGQERVKKHRTIPGRVQQSDGSDSSQSGKSSKSSTVSSKKSESTSEASSYESSDELDSRVGN